MDSSLALRKAVELMNSSIIETPELGVRASLDASTASLEALRRGNHQGTITKHICLFRIVVLFVYVENWPTK
jgi:hypothetical protein